MRIPFSPPDITEAEISEVADTLRSGWITTGPKTKCFENMLKNYCSCAGAACFSSATAALEMILRLLGIGHGDEVIVPAYTYTASASVVCHVGAKLVLCDSSKDSFEMDYDSLPELITERTKAIIAVDIGGVPCNYSRLFEAADNKRKLFSPNNAMQVAMGRIAVLADAAHALGSERDGIKCGNMADFSSFSFHAVKNLTTGEGGAALWKYNSKIDSEEIYRQFMLLSLHGQTKDALEKNRAGGWEYDIAEPYFKCNMTDIAASIGIAQLRRYDEILSKRQKLVCLYNAGLESLPVEILHHQRENYRSNGHLYMVRLRGKDSDFRNEVIKRLADNGVSSNVHYKPLPMLSAYKKLGFSIDDFPNAYEMYENEITLPLYSKLTDEEAKYVIECFIKCVK